MTSSELVHSHNNDGSPLFRPANILLSATNPPIPVLVDFGFAEKYDIGSKKAFISNLAYGTPEVHGH